MATLQSTLDTLLLVPNEQCTFTHHTPDDSSWEQLAAVKEMERMKKDLQAVRVVSVNHPDQLQEAFSSRQKYVALHNDNDHNTQILYCSCPCLAQLFTFGLEPTDGSFGHGLYFSSNLRKVNDTCSTAGMEGVRAMLRCRVVLGRVQEYRRGMFDQRTAKGLIAQGFHSVLGFVDGHEHVVYDPSQVLVSEIILYQPVDVHAEREAMQMREEDAFRAKMAGTSPKLREYVQATLKLVDGDAEATAALQAAARRLLMQQCTEAEYINAVQAVLQPWAAGGPRGNEGKGGRRAAAETLCMDEG